MEPNAPNSSDVWRRVATDASKHGDPTTPLDQQAAYLQTEHAADLIRAREKNILMQGKNPLRTKDRSDFLDLAGLFTMLENGEYGPVRVAYPDKSNEDFVGIDHFVLAIGKSGAQYVYAISEDTGKIYLWSVGKNGPKTKGHQ